MTPTTRTSDPASFRGAPRLFGKAWLFCAMVCGGVLSLVQPSRATPLVVADKQTSVRIVCSGTATADAQSQYLRHFLEERHFPVSPVLHREPLTPTESCEWILSDTNSLAPLGIRSSFSGLQALHEDESFWLKAEQAEGHARVILVANSAQGLRAAVARLLCKLANHGATLTLEAGESLHRPFIRRRLLDLGNSARRQIPQGSPFKTVDVETWSPERLRAYPELFWQFGFNAIQVEEVRGYGSLSDQQLPPIRKALQLLAEEGRARGMHVSLFQWGDCLYQEGVTQSWNNPAEHVALLAFARDLANGYASRLDHVNIHFGDPGGCQRDGCDSYKTPQQVTAAYYAAFQSINPNVEFSLSTWAWGDFWSYCPHRLDLSNYAPYFPEMARSKTFGRPIPGGGKFLDATFMPLNIGIALHRTYNRDQAAAVLVSLGARFEKGRKWPKVTKRGRNLGVLELNREVGTVCVSGGLKMG